MRRRRRCGRQRDHPLSRVAGEGRVTVRAKSGAQCPLTPLVLVGWLEHYLSRQNGGRRTTGPERPTNLTSPRAGLCHFLEQRVRPFEVRRVEAFGKPAVDRGENGTGIGMAALVAAGPGETDRRA